MYRNLAPSIVAVACFLANTATADTFNSEVKLQLADNNSYSVSLSPNYRYYLNAVDDSFGPLEMAGFLNQTSSIFTSFQNTNLPRYSAYSHALSGSVEADFVFENGVNLGLGGVQERWYFDSSQNPLVLNVDTKQLDFGYYINQFNHINLGYQSMSSSEDQTMKTFILKGISLIPLTESRYLKLEAVVKKADHIANVWDSQSIELDTTYYPQYNLGLSAGLDYTVYGEQNNQIIYSLGTQYFFDTDFYAAINMNMIMQGCENWSSQQIMSLGARF